MSGIMVRRLSATPKRPVNLQKAKAHEIGAERHTQEDNPAGQLEIRRDLIGRIKLDYELCSHRCDDKREKCASKQAEHHYLLAWGWLQHVDHDVDANMDACAHAVGGAEFRHPHEHVDAQLLRPRQIDVIKDRIEKWDTDCVALHNRNKDQQRRGRDQARDQNFLKTIENTKKHLRLAHLGTWQSRGGRSRIVDGRRSHGSRLYWLFRIPTPGSQGTPAER